MNIIEIALYELSHLFLIPVLLLILLSLGYAFFALGRFAIEGWQRQRGHYRSTLLTTSLPQHTALHDLELQVMKHLELLRIVSRSTPMLGLIATMIPMGPALLALTQHDAQAIGDNLVIAFSAVILALLSASITFFILTIKRRWLLEDLRQIERAQEVTYAIS